MQTVGILGRAVPCMAKDDVNNAVSNWRGLELESLVSY